MKWKKGKEDVLVEGEAVLMSDSFCTCLEGDTIVEGTVIQKSSGSKNRISERYSYEAEVLILSEESGEIMGTIKDVSSFVLKLECEEASLKVKEYIEIFLIDISITLDCLIVRKSKENEKIIY